MTGKKKKHYTPGHYDPEKGFAIQLKDSDTVEPPGSCKLCSTGKMTKKLYFVHIKGRAHKKVLKKIKSVEFLKTTVQRTVRVDGYHENASYEEFIDPFYNFGVINLVSYDNFSFLEFETIAGKEAVLKANIYIRNRKLRITPKISATNDNYNPYEPPISFNLQKQISQLGGIETIDNKIKMLMNEVLLTTQDLNKRTSLAGFVQNCLNVWFPNTTVFIFGSSANNIGFKGTDLDIFAYLESNPWGSMPVPEASKAGAKLAFKIRALLMKQYDFYNVTPVPSARVPLVKFTHKSTGIKCDLSFRSYMPVVNTKLIYMYTQVHPLVRPYLVFVRFWAKMQDIAGGGKPTILITNYALTMMMLFVLMKSTPSIIPNVSELQMDAKNRNIPPNMIENWNCSFTSNCQQYMHRNHTKSVFQLAKSFFKFYSEYESSKHLISPAVGQVLLRETFQRRNSSELHPIFNHYCLNTDESTSLNMDTPLCVQDPFDHSFNLTRGLLDDYLQYFQFKCKRALEMCEDIEHGKIPLNKLFEYIPTESIQTVPPTLILLNRPKLLQNNKLNASADTQKSAELDGNKKSKLVNDPVTTATASRPIKITPSVPSVNASIVKILFNIRPIKAFDINNTGQITFDCDEILNLQQSADMYCKLMLFLLEHCFLMNIEPKSENTFEESAVSSDHIHKKFKNDVDGSFDPLTEYVCNTSHELWIGRAKISKQVLTFDNPLIHEINVTKKQLEKSVENPEIEISFTLKFLQSTNEKSNILLVISNSNPSKASNNRVNCMGIYLTSFLPKFAKKMGIFIEGLK